MKAPMMSGVLTWSALCLCVLAAPASAQKVSLDVAVPLASSLKPMHEALAAKFAAEHPDIQIKFDMTDKSYDELVQRALRAGMTGGLPDVAFHSYNRVQLLAERNLPVPLDSFIASEPKWGSNGLMSSTLGLAKVNDHYYGLPFNTSTIGIFYNLDLVRQAGGDPDKLPSDWDGIVSLAAKIQHLGGNKTGI